MEVVTERGIAWEVARVWCGVTRSFERALKNRNEGPQFCPLCHPESALKNGCRMPVEPTKPAHTALQMNETKQTGKRRPMK